MAKEANKTTIIALLVVAGIFLFLVGSFTGNIISVAKGNAGKVYTTTEIDAKLAQLTITQNRNVLNMLGGENCKVWNYKDITKTCREACANSANICISGFVTYFDKNLRNTRANPTPCWVPLESSPITDGAIDDLKGFCVCCRA